MRALLWWLGLAASLVLAAGCSCHRGCSTEPAGLPVPGDGASSIASGSGQSLAPQRTAAYPQASHAAVVADVFCINEAVAVPERLVRRGKLDPTTIAEMLEDDARAAVAVGARTIRVNSATYPFVNWQEWGRAARAEPRTDRHLAIVQQAGLEPIMVIGPWPGNQTANHTERYVPDDLAGYQAWVRAVVERYDGDGVDDAPGLLRPVRFWEVDNEPDLHNRVAPKAAKREVDPATFETPAQYAQVLVATAAAIREAQPDAVVLNGGTFHTGRDHGRAYMEQVLAVPGAADAVDAWSIHAYFEERSPDLYLAALDNAVALAADRPIFITETGVPSSRRGSSWIDEDFQARMLVFVFGEAMARGVERVCWHTLADPPSDKAAGGGFGTHSLHRTVGEPPQQTRELKPAGRVYQRLATALGATPLAEVSVEPVPGGRALRFGDLGWLVYEGEDLELSVDGSTVMDLLSGAEAPYQGTVDAPALLLLDRE